MTPPHGNTHNRPTVDPHALIASASAYYGIVPAEFLGRARAVDVNAARQELMTAMFLAGMSAAEIGRTLRRDHSTITHGVHSVKVSDGRMAHAFTIMRDAGAYVERCYTPGDLPRVLALALRKLPIAQQRAMTAYVQCTLLGQRRHAPTLCMWGLASLADAGMRRCVNSALVACGLGENVGRIDLQARNAKGRAA